MANVNAPFGLSWIGNLNSGLLAGEVNEYVIPSSDSNDYFIGDPVKSTGTGTSDGIPTVTAVAEGDTIRGVIVGFKFDPTDLNIVYGAASTTRTVYVADAPYARFLIQSDGTGAITDLGANADISTAVSGSTVSGISGVQLKESTVTSATAQLRILRNRQVVNNAVGLYNVYEVIINEHELKSTSGV
jgi:hypothetical protein